MTGSVQLCVYVCDSTIALVGDCAMQSSVNRTRLWLKAESCSLHNSIATCLVSWSSHCHQDFSGPVTTCCN